METAPVSAPSAEAVCPEHPEQSSTGTCPRCGRFVCARCEVREGECVSCQRRQVLALPLAGGRARFVTAMLWVCAASSAVMVLLHLWLLGSLDGGTVSVENAEVYDTLSGLIALPATLGFFTAAIVMLTWLHLVVRTARALGRSQEEPRWAVFAWFIPLANLVKPYHVVRDLWVGLGEELEDASLLPGWWGAWIIGNILSRLEQSLFKQVSDSPSMLSGALISGIVSEAVSLVAAVLCVRVVLGLQQRLDRRRAEVSDAAA
jgi:hypothetical protein